jgi:hypothetical protein
MEIDASLNRWHTVLRARDEGALPGLIAEDAVFRSPALFRPVEGRDAVVGYLTAAMRVLGNDAFAYHREWRNETGAILEFTTELDGREVHGVDMIEWNDDGLIQRFDVMVRPQSALTTVIEHMAAELARMLEG